MRNDHNKTMRILRRELAATALLMHRLALIAEQRIILRGKMATLDALEAAELGQDTLEEMQEADIKNEFVTLDANECEVSRQVKAYELMKIRISLAKWCAFYNEEREVR